MSKSGLAYKLNLPKKYRIYQTFPILVLEEYYKDGPIIEPDLKEDGYKVKIILIYKGPP